MKGLYLISWEEGAEGLEAYSWKKIEPIINLPDSRPWIPRTMKCFSQKIEGPVK
jgi:hypothetical protein